MRPLALLLLCAARAWCASPEERAIAHLERETAAWRAENHCFSCHNNGDAARALLLARSEGFAVREEALAETLEWLRHPERWKSNRTDFGFSDPELATMQFGVALSLAGGDSANGELARLQRSDGSWRVAGERGVSSPVTWGTPLATLLVGLALSDSHPGRWQRAREFLWRSPIDSTVTAAAVLLAAPTHAVAQAYLLSAITSEGAWGPRPRRPAEVFDTALAMVALHHAPNPPVQVVRRARAWLVARQLENGGWPETTRPPGGSSYAQHVSTTAWALMALVETAP